MKETKTLSRPCPLSNYWIGRVYNLENCNWMGNLSTNEFLDLSKPSLKDETACLLNEITVLVNDEIS